MKISDINLFDSEQELNRIVLQFNDTAADYPVDKTIDQLFDEQAARYPDHVAVQYNDQRFTYRELAAGANRIAAFLKNHTTTNAVVPMLLRNSADIVVVMIGILKAGCAYLPIDPDLPYERIKYLLNDSGAPVILGQKQFIKTLNRLQWECKRLQSFLCIDTDDTYAEQERQGDLAQVEFWNHVGESASDDISGGAWRSSYTGLDFTRGEMDEYAKNIYSKLKPYLTSETTVLEIGCSTGISMFRIAPEVRAYYGTDLSARILQWTQQKVNEKQLNNVTLFHLEADQIDTLEGQTFDVVILNSVIQCFNGHNYLRRVLASALRKMNPGGILFLGDIQDLDRKDALVASLEEFAREHAAAGYKTKTDWSNELFLSRSFLEDLCWQFPQIESVVFSDKLGTLENELTRYRYDALLTVAGRNATTPARPPRNKMQYDRRALYNGFAEQNVSLSKPNDIAYIIYTSGSTGMPKGCRITHTNVVRLMINDRNNFSFSSADTWIMAHNYSFDFSVWEMYGALLYGGKLIVPDRDDVKNVRALARLIRKHRVTVLNQTPLAFNYLAAEILDANDTALSEHLRMVIFGGDIVNPTLFRQWISVYPLEAIKLINMYGITETTVHVTYYEITRDDILREEAVNRVGRPLPETSVYVLNEYLRPVPLGVIGEIYVGGSGVAAGYLNKPDLTATRFIPNPFAAGGTLYKSGDMGRWHEDGILEVIGRQDNQIKIRGFRIELREIEHALHAINVIIGAMVMPVKEPDGSTALVAFVSITERIAFATLKEILALHLPVHAIPAYFCYVDEFPLTENGKLDRKRLMAWFENSQVKSSKVLPEKDTLQEAVSRIWADVLQKDDLGISDNFFDIGGHSLKGARVISRINKQYEVQLDLKVLFASPTIETLCVEINRAVKSEFPPLVPCVEQVSYETSNAQKRLWITNQLYKSEVIHHIQDAFSLQGTLHLDAFKQAVRKIVNRHEALRTSFIVEHDEVRQKVNVEASVEGVAISDFSNHPNGIAMTEALFATLSAQPFKLDRAPLWRIHIATLAPDHHRILICFHHIIFDGWSQKIFFEELAGWYEQFAYNVPFTPAPLPVQYRDYAAWCNTILKGEYLLKLKNYWLRQFESGVPSLQLPIDGTRGNTKQLRAKSVSTFFDPGFIRQLNTLCSGQSVSVFAALLSALKALLYLYTAERNIVVGTSVAGRVQPELENQIGMYVNLLALKTEMLPSDTLHDVLARVHKTVLNGLAHQLYPFDKLVEDLNIRKDPARHPLFDVLIVLQNFETAGEAETQAFRNVSMSHLNTGVSTVEYDLTFSFQQIDGGLSLSLLYKPDLFSGDRIALMLKRYEALVELLVEKPDLQLVEINNEVESKFMTPVTTPGIYLNL